MQKGPPRANGWLGQIRIDKIVGMCIISGMPGHPKYTFSKPSRQKVDLKKCLSLSFEHGLGDSDIARMFRVSPQAVAERLRPFRRLIKDPAAIARYKSSKADFLAGIELDLLADMTDKGKRDKASLNNTAYAYAQVANDRRLEEGRATAIYDMSPYRAQATKLGEAIGELERAYPDYAAEVHAKYVDSPNTETSKAMDSPTNETVNDKTCVNNGTEGLNVPLLLADSLKEEHSSNEETDK